MSAAELRPFADEHLPGAARLLAERYARHRAAEPLLAEGDARQAVERAWRREGASGTVALRGGEVAGYLLGQVGEARHFDRHAWVERAGHAATDPELVRDLYAAAAEAWLDAGARRHFALVPALDEALDPWYRLGFAQMHVEAARASGGAGGGLPAGLTIRRGGRDDIEAALRVNRLIASHQARSPSYAFLAEPSEQEERADWEETFAEPGVAYFLVERDGRVLGHSLLYPPGPDLGVPADAIYLASTATIPEVRGEGVGLALTEHVLAWAREAGHATVVTNWRATNLLASRFWSARGFRTVFIRMHRAIGAG
jgi:ribosomal protein S18 acetylase RimI-like enzyme